MAAKRILPPSNRALSGAVFFTVKNASERAILTFEWDATGVFESDSRIVTSDLRSEMPLYPFLSVILWMGLVQVMLDGTDDLPERTTTPHMPDPDYLLTNRDNVVVFPAVAQ